MVCWFVGLLVLQIRWHGADRAKFIEKVVVGDIQGLGDGEGLLSLITNDNGGIMDDTVITNAGDFVYMVVNGATKFGDMEHFQKHLDDFDGDVTMEYLEDTMQLLGGGQAPGQRPMFQAGNGRAEAPCSYVP